MRRPFYWHGVRCKWGSSCSTHLARSTGHGEDEERCACAEHGADRWRPVKGRRSWSAHGKRANHRRRAATKPQHHLSVYVCVARVSRPASCRANHRLPPAFNGMRVTCNPYRRSGLTFLNDADREGATRWRPTPVAKLAAFTVMATRPRPPAPGKEGGRPSWPGRAWSYLCYHWQVASMGGWATWARYLGASSCRPAQHQRRPSPAPPPC